MSHGKQNSFKTLLTVECNGKTYNYHSLPKFASGNKLDLSNLPFSLKILLENLLRTEDGVVVTEKDILSVANWNPKSKPDKEIQYTPARIILQDFTGVPAVADLAAMRGAIKKLGGEPAKINPLQQADLVIDHSVQVDHYGSGDALKLNTALEFERNRERYQFLRWGQTAFNNFSVVPPSTGIVHQVNLEYLGRVAITNTIDGDDWVYPDTLVGTDSHTTMINGLGIMGWGVGGIEAEAAMLGQPISMLIPQVVGFKLTGKLPVGTTSTDLVLHVVEILRKKGVVGKFVEFFGEGLRQLSLADRATIANMAPEYGATIGLFPVDEQTIEYLKLSKRDDSAQLTETYFKAQGMWYDPENDATYSDVVELDMNTVSPCLAGPSRPQDRVNLNQLDSAFKESLNTLAKGSPADAKAEVLLNGQTSQLEHGSIVIAAITSCTNTSNPAGLITAGLLAKKAVEKGLQSKPWVKTSLAPGSKVVTGYLRDAGLEDYLEKLNFHTVGYGCTTCIGNGGTLPDHISQPIAEQQLVAVSVLSGNRNFEGRISPHVRANYLASPALVVAYALAGSVKVNLEKDPIAKNDKGEDVFLKDIWPSPEEVQSVVKQHVTSDLFAKGYDDVFKGSDEWQGIQSTESELYDWDLSSTYIKEPPFFDQMGKEPEPVHDVENAHVLALLKDSVTTDHISPAGAIQKDSPAGQYLISKGVDPKDFNQFGARRGNHEVMLRGTFGNIRLKNQLVPGVEGGFTKHLPDGEQMSIYDASVKYKESGTPLIVIAGKEYGTGSSRDWAAKGTLLLGIRAVIAESFERIHRSNLIGMGVLPLQFQNNEGAEAHGLTGEEVFSISGLKDMQPGSTLTVKATNSGQNKEFQVLSRIDTPNELEYFKNGGILQYVLRQALKS